VLLQEREITPAVSRWILQLLAYITDGLAFPRHFDRRQLPTRVSRNAPVGSAFVQIVVAIGVARGAMIASDPGPVRTSLSCRLM
jgi:hypothetical protein